MEQIAGEHGRQIVAKEVMADHVHLFVRVGATDAPASVAWVLTGRTGRVLSESTVRRSIEHQCDAVIAS